MYLFLLDEYSRMFSTSDLVILSTLTLLITYASVVSFISAVSGMIAEV